MATHGAPGLVPMALLYLVLSKYLFLPSSRDHSSEMTYLSNERFCLKFGRFFAEILKSEYQEILLWSPIYTEIYGVLKVKNRNFSQPFLCNENCIDIFWVSPLTAHVGSKFLAMHNKTLRHKKTSRFFFLLAREIANHSYAQNTPLTQALNPFRRQSRLNALKKFA